VTSGSPRARRLPDPVPIRLFRLGSRATRPARGRLPTRRAVARNQDFAHCPGRSRAQVVCRAPGGASPSGSHRGRLLAAAIIAVLIVVVAATLIIVLTTAKDPSATANPTTTDLGTPSPVEELPAGGILDGAGSNSAVEAGPAEPADESALRELIPLDFRASSCTATARPADDGSLAALTCGPSISSPGANASEFFLYAESADVTAAFVEYAQERALDELPSGNAAGCGQDQGVASYSQGGPVLGDLACFIDSEDTAYLAWTNTELNVFAITSAASGDAAGLRELYDWWVARGQITRR